jgi:N6-L-threonylcarbamoyladenine synthase
MDSGVTCVQATLQRKADMRRPITILGLESSCDDTAAAIVQINADKKATILANIVAAQTDLHAAFGGIVPEIAARAHVEKLDYCVELALTKANLALSDIDAFAVTAGPGLIGGVVSGVMCAKGLSAATGKPLYGVNHLAGHALTPRLTDNVPYPYLMLLVSGGHCQFLMVHSPDSFQRLGGTIDDAPGEAFDKVARLINLPQPGGPSIEQAALSGNPERFAFPRPLMDRDGCDMSFSGLKTAVLRARDALVAEQGGLREQDQADLAASFQSAVVDVLAEKTRRAFASYPEDTYRSICVAGGVAANMPIRAALESVSAEQNARFIAPPLELCTDNAAMIAYAAAEQSMLRGPDDMTLSARPRWPLDTTQPAMLGSGKKGAKA